MDNIEKITKYKSLSRGSEDDFFQAMSEAGDVVYNYYDYIESNNGMDCDKELQRLETADYKLCCVLLTMLLREDHFSNGSFEWRYKNGQVQPIVDRMISLLESTTV